MIFDKYVVKACRESLSRLHVEKVTSSIYPAILVHEKLAKPSRRTWISVQAEAVECCLSVRYSFHKGYVSEYLLDLLKMQNEVL